MYFSVLFYSFLYLINIYLYVFSFPMHTLMCVCTRESSSHFPVLPLVSLPSESCIWSVTVGVILNQEHAYRRVDKGPSSDDVEVSSLGTIGVFPHVYCTP